MDDLLTRAEAWLAKHTEGLVAGWTERLIRDLAERVRNLMVERDEAVALLRRWGGIHLLGAFSDELDRDTRTFLARVDGRGEG